MTCKLRHALREHRTLVGDGETLIQFAGKLAEPRNGPFWGCRLRLVSSSVLA